MPTDPKITQIEVFDQFALKKRRVTRIGFVVLPIFVALAVSFLLEIEGTAMAWIIGVGFFGLLLTLVFGNIDWSCPACGKLFRKSGTRIRFCPHCGVALVAGAVREEPQLETKTPAEHDGGLNGLQP